MPAPRTDIDRNTVAASVAMRGIRGTAREMGLPVATVQDIAKAGGVVVPGALTRTVTERTTSVQSVQGANGLHQQPMHALITDEMARLGAKSKLAVAKYAARVLPYAAKTAKLDAEKALTMAGDVKSVVSGAQMANVPGFERQVDDRSSMVVSIALLGLPPEPEPMVEAIDIGGYCTLDPMSDEMF
jgi:hypothetical protein